MTRGTQSRAGAVVPLPDDSPQPLRVLDLFEVRKGE